MKTLPIHLAAMYRSRDATLSHGLRITRRDGQVFAFTSNNRSVRIAGVQYSARQGLNVTSVSLSAGFEVSNLELETIDDGSLFSRSEVQGGLWQNAKFLLFRYDWALPPASLADVDEITAGRIGEVKLLDGKVSVELRGIQQALQQPVGEASSKTCRARYGDTRCKFDISTRTHAGSIVSAVTSKLVFRAAALAQATDYFGEGEIRWTSGANEGLRYRVKSHTNSSGAVFSLAIPVEEEIQIGDTFVAIGGCRRRREDCKDRSNILNFQGEPDRPGVDALTAQPDQEV